MSRSRVAALALLSAGCSTGWRAGVGLSADTGASVGAQVFVGTHFGVKSGDSNAIEVGAEGATSLRSAPLRIGAGVDGRADFRHESRDMKAGWMLGLYDGVRGLFFHGQNGELRTGLEFDLLPVISLVGDTWRHFGGEVQAGLSSPLSSGDDLPPTRGEFALRFFYEVVTIGDQGPF